MKKGWAVIGGLFIAAAPLIVLAVTAYTLMLPNVYQASVRISVSEDTPPVNPFAKNQESYTAYNPYFLRTQFETLTSKPVLYEVINRLNLQSEWGRDSEKLPREVALKILRNSVDVFQQRDTSLIVISVKRDSPDAAAEIANEMAVVYRDSRMDHAIRNARAAIDKIDAAMKDQAKRVEFAEMKLQNLREELGIAEIGAEGAELTDNELQQLERDRLHAQAQMLEKQGLLKIFKQIEGRDVEHYPAGVPSGSSITATHNKRMMVEAELKVFKAEYGADHPEVKNLTLQKKALDELLAKQIKLERTALETELQIAKNKFESLNQTLGTLRENALDSQGEKYRPYRKALRDLESELFIYEQLKAKHRQEIVALEVPRNPVEIIDVAEPNRRPVSPNLFMNVIISVVMAGCFALIGGVLLAIGLHKPKASVS